MWDVLVGGFSFRMTQRRRGLDGPSTGSSIWGRKGSSYGGRREDGIDASRNFAGLIRSHYLHAQVRQDTGLSPFLLDLAERLGHAGALWA
jgi:hypothetical protein